MLSSLPQFFRLLICTTLLATPPVIAQTVGDVLPARPDGAMDLHHINTGEGNAAFCVLPDGTTLLIDCGFGYDLKRPAFYKAPRRPDESRTPGEWVGRYIQHFHPDGEKGALDYLVVSHFHSDHMGGVPELAQRIAIGHILDRGWPDYQQPPAFTGEPAEKYRAALQVEVEKNGAKVERFLPGRADQIVLRREPAKYPNFEVRNLAANGVLWTGQGTETRSRIPAGATPEENTCSVVLRLRYGRFRYYSGGDLTGTVNDQLVPGTTAAPAQLRAPVWRDMESALAWVTGPVDVLLLDHHGNSDGSNSFFLSVLQPRVAISNVWASRQVDVETLGRLQSEETYPGPRDLFTTNGMWPGRKEHLIKIYGEQGALRHIADLERLAATQGHIVVRVAPGGESFTVFVLDDSAETFRIKSIHGPYTPQP
jgi:hypothetical protein